MKKNLVYDEVYFKIDGLSIHKWLRDKNYNVMYEEWNGSREVTIYI